MSKNNEISNKVHTSVFIGGSPKAGTSSMWYYLSQHPNIYGGEEKEIHFFTGNNWNRGVKWYTKKYRGYEGEKHVLDGSHTLITAPDVALDRIDRFIEDPKFIFLIRDPIDRLVSTYKFGFKYGQKSYKYHGTFAEWIRSEDSERDIEYGKYFKHISRFGSRFGKSNVKTIIHKNMSENTVGTVKNIYRYLGVDEGFEPHIKVINKSGRASRGYRVVSMMQKGIRYVERVAGVRLRNAATNSIKSILLGMMKKDRIVTEKDRQYLTDVYSSDAEMLQDYLGCDLSHWSVLR